jgi:FAD/FMN-containing dehydrogenase
VIDDVPVDRRTVLRWLAVGSAALAGCSSGPGKQTSGSSTSSSSPTTARSTSTSAAPPGVPWGQLQRNLGGRVVLPAAPTYLRDLQLYDPRFDNARPAAIAFCANPADVQRCVAFARAHDVPFAARSGGHSYAGYSTTTGLVIDVTAMSSVTLAGTEATIGAGARIIDLYTNLNTRGVSIPGGSCPTVGIAGLALGGGIGVVARRYGLTCDALTGVQLVTADSRLVTADAANDDDLFWACRGGGGGNFGIATAFDFATFPTTDVALFTLKWPWAAAPQVLAAWMAWIADAPDPLWSNCILAPGSPSPLLQVAGIWVGAQSEAAPYIDRLIANTGTRPSTRFLETIPLEHAMYVEAGCARLSESACHTTGQTAQAQLSRGASFASSNFIDRPLSDAGISAVVAGINERIEAHRPGAIAFDAYGGAINRMAAAATAFVHRDSLCCAQYSVSFNPADSSAAVAEHRAWLAGYSRALRPHVSESAYQNYIDPTLSDSLDAYYGTNLARLRTTKKKWDADNVFRFAQSIPPA